MSFPVKREAPMLITCPACDARYKVDPELIFDDGRTVRCSACDAEWTVWPQAEAAPQAASAAASARSAAETEGAAPRSEPERDARPERSAVDFAPLDPPETQLARSLEDRKDARGGGGWFLWGFAVAAAAALGAAILYIRHEEIAAAAPQLAGLLGDYAAFVDALRERLSALAARFAN